MFLGATPSVVLAQRYSCSQPLFSFLILEFWKGACVVCILLPQEIFITTTYQTRIASLLRKLASKAFEIDYISAYYRRGYRRVSKEFIVHSEPCIEKVLP